MEAIRLKVYIPDGLRCLGPPISELDILSPKASTLLGIAITGSLHSCWSALLGCLNCLEQSISNLLIHSLRASRLLGN